jgi:mannose-6-phosphate isomerase-like protein (cupin superfamily)
MATGDWIQNVKTKELVRADVHPDDTAGRSAVATMWLEPGAAVVGEHVHDHLLERFAVIEGELGVSLDGKEQTARPGTVVTVPAGTAHDWWNAGTGGAQVRVEIEATPGSGPMAARFVDMIEVIFGLANTGRTNEKGLPSPLWLAAVAHEYADVLRFTRPPAIVQRVVFGPLAALARRTGRDPAAAWLHGPDAPARVEAPAEMPTTV